ncbi:hypothetical protein AB0395_24750 [Streptosporangium sp. NPDC051023]|uniref:hypothetical protein n=1 Tax=Streptosporangium sp. NPDC051023 TaxID=3155410 RepID=UPI00344B7F2C
MTDRDNALISLLGSIYPGWRYEQIFLPGLPRWWAHRLGRITAAQHAAGARGSVGRTTPERLAAALAVHTGILHRVRH